MRFKGEKWELVGDIIRALRKIKLAFVRFAPTFLVGG